MATRSKNNRSSARSIVGPSAQTSGYFDNYNQPGAVDFNRTSAPEPSLPTLTAEGTPLPVLQGRDRTSEGGSFNQGSPRLDGYSYSGTPGTMGSLAGTLGDVGAIGKFAGVAAKDKSIYDAASAIGKAGTALGIGSDVMNGNYMDAGIKGLSLAGSPLASPAAGLYGAYKSLQTDRPEDTVAALAGVANPIAGIVGQLGARAVTNTQLGWNVDKDLGPFGAFGLGYSIQNDPDPIGALVAAKEGMTPAMPAGTMAAQREAAVAAAQQQQAANLQAEAQAQATAAERSQWGSGGSYGGGGYSSPGATGTPTSNYASRQGFSGATSTSDSGNTGSGPGSGGQVGGNMGGYGGADNGYADGGIVGLSFSDAPATTLTQLNLANGGAVGAPGLGTQGGENPEMLMMRVNQMVRDPRVQKGAQMVVGQAMQSGQLTPDELVTIGRIAQAAVYNPKLYPQLRSFAGAQGIPLPPAYDQRMVITMLVASKIMGRTPAGQVPPTDVATMENPTGDDEGGFLQGPGTGRSDSIGTVNRKNGGPVSVATNEYVIPEHVVAAKGRDFFDKMLRQYAQLTPKGD